MSNGLPGGRSVSDSGVLILNSATHAISGTLTGTWTQAVAPPGNTGSDTITVQLTRA
jgi:hypothetical protein